MEVYRLIFYKIYHNNHHLKILSPRQDYPSRILLHKFYLIGGLQANTQSSHTDHVCSGDIRLYKSIYSTFTKPDTYWRYIR